MDTTCRSVVLMLLAAVVLPASPAAAAGDLDASFDLDGKVVTGISDKNDGSGLAVAIQPDGKIVVAGYAMNGGYNDFALVRYEADGTPDTAFGVNGEVMTDVSSRHDQAYGVALQTDGRIVVVGETLNGFGNYDFAVVRYNSDGSLDATFDGDGKVVTSIGSYSEVATSVAIQPNGKIVVAGYTAVGSYADFAVLRYNADGSLDATFDGDGKVITAVGAGNDRANSVTLQSDLKIVVAGDTYGGGDYDFAVVRYNTNGSLDATFDADGIAITSLGTSTDRAYAVAMDGGLIVVAGVTGTRDFAVARYKAGGALDLTFDTDGIAVTAVAGAGELAEARSVAVKSGKVTVAGYLQSGADADFVVVRYDTDGSLDTTFDTDGIVTTAVGAGWDDGAATAIQGDGRTVVAGSSSNGSNFDFAVVRYGADGSLDLGFDADGIATTTLGVSGDYAHGIAVQSDGKIVVAANSDQGNSEVAVLRYNTDGSLDSAFGGSGAVTTAVTSYEDSGEAVAIQPDGKIVVAGYSMGGGGLGDFLVLRYNADGTLDTTFDADGVAITPIGSNLEEGRALALSQDGKIIVAGYSWTGATYDFGVVRYNADGSLDTTFDADGKVTTAIGVHDYASSVAVQSDGKIVVAGYSYNGSDYDFAVVRYDIDGSLDETFGTGGKTTTPIGSLDDTAYSVAVQDDGRILVAGRFDNGSDYDFAIVRYNADGSLDTTLDGDGKATAGGPNDQLGAALALQPDAKILLGGTSGGDFAVARYDSMGSLDTTFGAGGIVTTDFAAGTDAAAAVALQADGRVLAAGRTIGESGWNIAVARYLQLCGNFPQSGCNSTNGMAVLVVKNNATDARDTLRLKWLKGTSSFADFGDPTATTGYALCLYDGDGPVLDLEVPAAVSCGVQPCWSLTGPIGVETGVSYRDRQKPAQYAGVRQIVGRAGTAGRARLQVVALGQNIPPFTLGTGLAGTVTVQVVTDNAACWAQQFTSSDTRRNDTAQFKATYRAP